MILCRPGVQSRTSPPEHLVRWLLVTHGLGVKDEQQNPSQRKLLYQTSSLTPLPTNRAKTSGLHSTGMAVVVFIWGHRNTSKENPMSEICVCHIHLLIFVRQLLRHGGIHEKQLNFCDFY